MSKIALTPNASGTGTLTIAAPNTSTDRTLTLPDVTTTLVGTDATQTLTNKSIASSQLTGALPAIDGSALTGIVTGGMTLLGTLTTTSGSTQTLSGLTLTSYQQVWAVFKNVSPTSVAFLRLSSASGVVISDPTVGVPIANGVYGTVIIDLATSVVSSSLSQTNLVAENNANVAAYSLAGVQNTVTSASTSIAFYTTAGTFDNGSIRIYGVK